MRIEALEAQLEAVGAGGVQPLVFRRNVTGNCADTAPTAINSGAAIDALAEAEYFIGNPSAWESFDQRASDAIDAVCKALRAAIEAAPQQAAQEPFRPDWMSYKQGFKSGMDEAREQVEPLVKQMLEAFESDRLDVEDWPEASRTALAAARAWLESEAPQQAAPAEPVAWQRRCRPTWVGGRPWSPWEPCTKEQAEDCWKKPLQHHWEYEARALCTSPQPGLVPLADVLARVDACMGPNSAVRLALVREFGSAS